MKETIEYYSHGMIDPFADQFQTLHGEKALEKIFWILHIYKYFGSMKMI